ncbi:MAG: NUDIX hydrolase [Candidatus Peribacteraceae bacterium]|nr:NUDIX hydrolase [Candidatus Peribacteraceae bacterium]
MRKKPDSPMLTVDAIIKYRDGFVVVKRKNEPLGFALPGGVVDVGERVKDAVIREVKEETNLDFTIDNLLGIYSDPDRDPRGHAVSIVFYGKGEGELKAGSDAVDVNIIYEWPVNLTFAFDHSRIITDYMEMLRDNKGTHSRCQDALRAGFQTTCDSGLAKLFSLEEKTYEVCQDFLPRHLEEFEAFVHKAKRELDVELKKWSKIRRTKAEFNDKWFEGLWWMIRHPIEAFKDFNSYIKRYNKWFELVIDYPDLEIVEVTETDPVVDRVSGVISSEVTLLCDRLHDSVVSDHRGELQHYTYKKRTSAKRGALNYVKWDDYNRSYIPEDAVDVVKEAIDMGLEKIHVVYPVLAKAEEEKSDKVRGVEERPAWDPIVVGYVGNTMFMIAWFGYDASEPMACNI